MMYDFNQSVVSRLPVSCCRQAIVGWPVFVDHVWEPSVCIADESLHTWADFLWWHYKQSCREAKFIFFRHHKPWYKHRNPRAKPERSIATDRRNLFVGLPTPWEPHVDATTNTSNTTSRYR